MIKLRQLAILTSRYIRELIALIIPNRLRKKAETLLDVTIGVSILKIPSTNPLSVYYSEHPNHSQFLARLAAAVIRKYPNSVIVDVGANVGDTLAIMRSQVSSHMIGVEGDPKCFRFLEFNTKQIGNITPVNCFLTDQVGTKKVDVEKQGWNSTLIESPSGNDVHFLTLDTLLNDLGKLESCKLLKIDTEGYDLKILRGSQKVLSHGHPILNFEYNRENLDIIENDPLSIFGFLQNFGYKWFLTFDDRCRFMMNGTLYDTELLANLHAMNGRGNTVYYYDFVIFHESDQDLAASYLKIERETQFRINP